VSRLTVEGRFEQLIKQKRAFLKQSTKDYSTGGNDMLDDVASLLDEAKADLNHQLEVISCIKEDEGEAAWRKECLSLYARWFEKWFGKS
jgi:hypothetical protein